MIILNATIKDLTRTQHAVLNHVSVGKAEVISLPQGLKIKWDNLNEDNWKDVCKELLKFISTCGSNKEGAQHVILDSKHFLPATVYVANKLEVAGYVPITWHDNSYYNVITGKIL